MRPFVDSSTHVIHPSDDGAAAYLLDMVSSLAHFAHVSNLQNTSIMLAAVSQVLNQECKLAREERLACVKNFDANFEFPYLDNQRPGVSPEE